jgi:hypothetical protein
MDEQREFATAVSRTALHSAIHKEIEMTTSKPVELGKVSEETKEVGPGPIDHIGSLEGPFTA